MSLLMPIHWHHSQPDLIWPVGLAKRTVLTFVFFSNICFYMIKLFGFGDRKNAKSFTARVCLSAIIFSYYNILLTMLYWRA